MWGVVGTGGAPEYCAMTDHLTGELISSLA